MPDFTRLLRHLPVWLSKLIIEIFSITYNLFKLMIPIIIAVKIIEELGGIKYIAMALEPLMSLVGLPESMGLVWATTMISNIYGGMIIFISNTNESLSIAQVTVIGSMMLLAHALPIEVRIAQKAGVRILYILLLRIGGALLLGFLLHQVYSSGNYLSQTAQPLWKPQIITDNSLATWVINQLKTLGQVFLIIAALVVFLRILRASGIEKLMAFILKPFLMLLGLTDKTTSINIIGLTLGLTYGGGLLINEAKKGHLSKLDIIGSLSLLSIVHSILEDSVIIMLLGADLSGILYARLIFSILLIIIIVQIIKRLHDATINRYFVYPNNK